ncbi:hypothetical protein RND71_012856 [Anisodus tanguticus]|uniref:K-box domain-containing protein n=1 Tax=Anisodus tanguticus TaxID=243964 RepID=A0AAE1SGG4_9SOLA|nr:hypothetical protein RND71_012856 [Anisodus tanguticus]
MEKNEIVRATIDRYKKHHADSTSTGSVSEANTQYYQQEASKLRRQIRDIQTYNRQIVGDALSSLSPRDLKNLEGKLEKAIGRVRCKKVNSNFVARFHCFTITVRQKLRYVYGFPE